MEPSEVLKLMNDIKKDIPLTMEHETDARDVWPKRWETLFKQIHKSQAY